MAYDLMTSATKSHVKTPSKATVRMLSHGDLALVSGEGNGQDPITFISVNRSEAPALLYLMAKGSGLIDANAEAILASHDAGSAVNSLIMSSAFIAERLSKDWNLLRDADAQEARMLAQSKVLRTAADFSMHEAIKAIRSLGLPEEQSVCIGGLYGAAKGMGLIVAECKGVVCIARGADVIVMDRLQVLESMRLWFNCVDSSMYQPLLKAAEASPHASNDIR